MNSFYKIKTFEALVKFIDPEAKNAIGYYKLLFRAADKLNYPCFYFISQYYSLNLSIYDNKLLKSICRNTLSNYNKENRLKIFNLIINHEKVINSLNKEVISSLEQLEYRNFASQKLMSHKINDF